MISPKEFFDKCCDGTLQESDFDFIKKEQDEKSVKGTVRRKINALPDMMVLFDKAPMVEDFQKNNVACSFAAVDGSCTLGFSKSIKGRPKSLIKGNTLSNPSKVDLILRKKSGEKLFNEIILGDLDDLERYREEIQNLLAEQLL